VTTTDSSIDVSRQTRKPARTRHSPVFCRHRATDPTASPFTRSDARKVPTAGSSGDRIELFYQLIGCLRGTIRVSMPERLVHRYYDPNTGQFLTADPLVAETGELYAYTSDDPVNARDPNGDIPVPGPGPDITVGDILSNPPLIRNYQNPQDLLNALGGVPAGWVEAPANYQKIAPGWKISARNADNTAFSGDLIRWGATTRPDHIEGWTWTVSNSSGSPQGKFQYPAGNWPGGPKEYVGDTGGVLNSTSSDQDSSGGAGDEPTAPDGSSTVGPAPIPPDHPDEPLLVLPGTTTGC
jgi:hypothetical protein